MSKKRKEIAIVGLGRMGKNMKARLQEKGWRVLGFDKNPDFSHIVKKMVSPKIVWLMVPAGKAVDDLIFGETGLVNILKRGDVIIDGGNSFFEDSQKRAKKLAKMGIEFLDVGVSGGPEGARKGACLMIGGKRAVFLKLKELFKDLATKGGFQYVGNSGAGHFVKMVHNGIEYGMMQSIAEGFNLMKSAPFKLSLRKIADLYNHGSVIQSRLVEWLKKSFLKWGEKLKDVTGSVAHSGEGEWMVKTAKKWGIPLRIIEESLKFRILSHNRPSYTGKIISALRGQFGKHNVKKVHKK